MKLVEILARELEKWPEGATHAVQDDDGIVGFTEGGHPGREVSGWSVRAAGADPSSYWVIGADTPSKLSSDHATAVVTREMWQAERDKLEAYRLGLKKNIKPKKANADGWVRHRGGKCPVEAGTVIEYRLRKRGAGIAAYPEQLNWGHDNHIGDIMAYRIIKSAEQPAPEIKVTHIDGEAGVIHAESVSSSCGPVKAEWSEIQDSGPLQWRDRIREIDRTVEALEEERVSLIQRLEGEGFKLIDQINAKIEEAARAHEDMGDWRNWKAGDFLQYIGENDSKFYTSGEKYKICQFLPGDKESSCVFDDNRGNEDHHWGYDDDLTDNFKWHSRPSD